MKNCFGFLVLAVILVGLFALPATADEYSSFIQWATVNGYADQGDPPPLTGFGDLLGSWAPNLGGGSLIGMAYDSGEEGLWIASEYGGGYLYLFDVNPPHNILRSINLLAFGLTSDGNQDGVAVDVANNRLLVADYQGDLVISDDIIYDIDYTTGLLNQPWIPDGAGNTSTDGSRIDMVLGVCVDGDGQVWASDNAGLLHSINLMADGTWNQNFQQAVPGGGCWAGLDWDPCLEEFYVANFCNQQAQYHDLLTNAPLDSFMGMNTTTGVSSNELNILYVGGFGDGVVYEHEGIECGPVAASESSWGAIKGLYR